MSADSRSVASCRASRNTTSDDRVRSVPTRTGPRSVIEAPREGDFMRWCTTRSAFRQPQRLAIDNWRVDCLRGELKAGDAIRGLTRLEAIGAGRRVRDQCG